MARMIPRKTKVQTQFYKNYTISDAVLAFVCLVLAALIALSGLGTLRWILLAALVLMFIFMMISVAPDTRVYQAIGYMFKYLFGHRNFKRTKLNTSGSVNSLMPYSSITEDGFIDYKGYFGGVLEIMPVEYYMLTEDRQNAFITAVDNAIKTMATNQTGMFVKLQRPMVLDTYINVEQGKIEEILKSEENGFATPAETNPRLDVVQSRIAMMEAHNVDAEDRLMKDHYYFVMFAQTKSSLKSGLSLIESTIAAGTNNSLHCRFLDSAETAVFLKNTFFDDIDEREVKEIELKDYMQWIMPDTIRFGSLKHYLNNKAYTTYTIADYPLTVRNAWGAAFFNIPGTKVVAKFHPVPQSDAERRLDKSIMEMEIQASKRGKTSTFIEKNKHLETLQNLLISLKTGNESLFDTNIFITAEDSQRKQVRNLLRRAGFRYNENFGMQKDAFINTNISQRSSMKKFERGINSSSLAAIFPFISDAVQDERGIYIGANSEPFFLDAFKRDKERINSNIIILGKSGSGKSFATKGLLTHLAADNSKIFVLDPEKEYVVMAKNLGGKVVDVGSAKEGRINPFHVVTSLEDEGDEGQNVSLSTHLQFLEEFFRIILDGITKDALEVLNECVKEVYDSMGITDKTDIVAMKPNQFPVFQDVYNYVIKKYDKARDDYERANLKIIRTYLNKFAEGGRNSNLWNGYSTITAEENFIVFQFQSLLANKNQDLANAQMLLVLRWLENEVFKNKDYNEKYHPDGNNKRRVIVAIDEAHVFIDPRRPVALDFMFQLAKRIRKYEGMQIVISQNIKDFVGSPDIARKSTAIINASQYSFIFSLAPNDINDLVALYEKAGEINESEQNSIVSNPRGRAFIITGPYSRTNVEIDLSRFVVQLFEKPLDTWTLKAEEEFVETEEVEVISNAEGEGTTASPVAVESTPAMENPTTEESQTEHIEESTPVIEPEPEQKVETKPVVKTKPATVKKTTTKATPAKKPATKAPVKKAITKATSTKKPTTKAPVKKATTKATPTKKPATKAPAKKSTTTTKKTTKK